MSLERKIYKILLFTFIGFQFLNLDLQSQLPEKKIKLNIQNRSLQFVFREISHQTGLFFTYDANLIDAKEKKTIQINNLSLKQSLDSILNRDDLAYTLIDKNIVIFRNNPIIIPVGNDKKLKFFRLTGVVKDLSDNAPLPFATIVLHGTNRGTLSNEKGAFSFSIPVDNENPILVLSMIGYENKHFVVDYSDKEDLIIKLKPRYISIEEVIIRYHNPEIILKDVIKKIPHNYFSDPSFMEAYFREFTYKNNEVMTFSEAVLEISKQSYQNTTSTDKVRIQKGRKISNISKEDSVLLKIKSGIHSSLQLDIIKNPNDFLQTDFQMYYDLNFSDIIYFKDRLTYVIHFKQKENIEQALYQGQLYIDIEEMALLAADFEINPSLIGKESSMFFIKKSENIKTRVLFAKYHVEYRKSEGSYHLSMVHAEVSFKIRKKRNWFSSIYKIVIELAVTNVDKEKEVKISHNEQVRPGTILSEENLAPDPLFWKEYNVILPSKELSKALERMGEKWKGMK